MAIVRNNYGYSSLAIFLGLTITMLDIQSSRKIKTLYLHSFCNDRDGSVSARKNKLQSSDFQYSLQRFLLNKAELRGGAQMPKKSVVTMNLITADSSSTDCGSTTGNAWFILDGLKSLAIS